MAKELRRSATDCKLFGVCGGIGEYFNIDSNLIRLVWIGISLFAGTGVILYIAAAILMPKADIRQRDLKDIIHPEREQNQEQSREQDHDKAADQV